MSEADGSPLQVDEIRLDMIDTLALELSDNPRVNDVVQKVASGGSKITAIKELRTLLANDEFESYRERISQIPEPIRALDTAYVSDESGRMKHLLPPASSEFVVAKTVVDLLFPDEKK